MTHTLRARRRPAHACRTSFVCLAVAILAAPGAQGREVSAQRLTPAVVAVREARPAVVSIQGQKIVSSTADMGGSDVPRQVNGMGTGTVIDERGYILTNYHVVSDVRRIEVTLDDGRAYTAELVAFDSRTDLAVIKIPTSNSLTTIRIGTSADLMEGESVIALGNAYGYEQTVTRGIISALGRDVQVSDTQSYDDLIQTDASINPGNSGGPLLNIDGEMIGVNVAVRAGAQGIGFAIPIDDALRIASQLLNVQRLNSKWHGLVTQPSGDPVGPLYVTKVESASPAAAIGLQPGDEIMQVGALPVARPLDLERALLDRSGQAVPIQVRRGGQLLTFDLQLADYRGPIVHPIAGGVQSSTWELLGLKLTEEPRATFQRRNTRYRGGMHVDEVRPDSPAAQQGILPGDILVGMHRWETASDQDLQYIVSRPNLAQMGRIKFYVLRGQNTLYGHINVATAGDTATRAALRR